MMSTNSGADGVGVRFLRLHSAGARERRDDVRRIHLDAYAATIATDDAFAGDGAFMQRFDSYTGRDGFTMIMAYAGDVPVGQAWGWPLAADTRWWEGLAAEPEPEFTNEDGTRTFALSEIMVGQSWTGQGIAHTLHDELLRGRTEQRATLLVRPSNAAAQVAYKRWGWTKHGELRPGWPDAPLMDVLMLPLPLCR